MLTIIFCMILCSLVYKNYFNEFLSTFALSLLVNGLLDLIIVRPLCFLIVSYPLTCNLRVLNLIQNEKLRDQMLEFSNKINVDGVKDLATNMSPRKKGTNSPTKIPKALKLKK